MKAVILAAGTGRRLGLDYPKCMADVDGTSIIGRQLAAFTAAGVAEYVIVVGYKQEQLRRHLENLPGRFTFIVNERYAETNTIFSLYLARGEMTGPFYYANADVVFDRRLLDRLNAAAGPAALAVQPGTCGEEEVKVVVRDGRILRIGKRLDPALCFGEFLGVARFGEQAAEPLAAMLKRYIESKGVVADYFERAVNRLCAHWVLTPVDVGDLPCCEIDFPEDLAFARQQLAPRLLP